MTSFEWNGYRALVDAPDGRLKAHYLISRDGAGEWRQLAVVGPGALDASRPEIAAFMADCPPVDQGMVAA